jgi:hypothetical protein
MTDAAWHAAKIMWNLIARQIWSTLKVSDAGLNLPVPLQNHSSMGDSA